LKHGVVAVTAPATCQWTATTPSSFISFDFTPSGIGNGGFDYTVHGNLTGTPRTGSLVVMGRSVSVTQRAALGSTTFLSFVSDPGDFVGQGWTLLHETPTSTFTVTPFSSRILQVKVAASERALTWRLTLAAPEGQQLAPGTYLNATRYPFQLATVPALDFSGNSNGCNVLTGPFTIVDLVYASDGGVEQLRVNFEQHCEARAPALRGTISYVR